MVFNNRLVVEVVDKNDPTYYLGQIIKERSEAFYKEYKHQKELIDLENRLYERLIKRLTVQVNDEASPVIADLRTEIQKLLNGGK